MHVIVPDVTRRFDDKHHHHHHWVDKLEDGSLRCVFPDLTVDVFEAILHLSFRMEAELVETPRGLGDAKVLVTEGRKFVRRGPDPTGPYFAEEF